ncbi:MAG: DUF484 family protein [Azoarcus sp.]|jgi:uncharacterized protein YigA (DUF484 family)|nr:DUF484 family protein [Azoarcus sp.]
MNPEEIAQYLRTHPDFLNEHSDLPAILTVPHPRHGHAISLTERQLHNLRGKIHQLELRLTELLRFGEQNDVISEKVHRLAISLLKAEDYAGRYRALLASMRDDFSVPHVALRIWDSPEPHDGDESLPVNEETRQFAENMTRPWCGTPPANTEALNWFGEMAPHIRSVALTRLWRGNKTAGLLALGSEEPERFYGEMGTLYLERIGALASAALITETS